MQASDAMAIRESMRRFVASVSGALSAHGTRCALGIGPEVSATDLCSMTVPRLGFAMPAV
jgi:hypothetical protein